jgi:ferredoxin
MGRTTAWLASPAEEHGSQRLPYGQIAAAWGSYFGRIPWTVMVTLTFDQKRVFPVPMALAESEAEDWCQFVAHMFRRPVGWLIGLERHKSGSWHAHLLLTDVRAVELGALVQCWKIRNGDMVDVQDVTNARGAVVYASKNAAAAGNIIVSDTLLRFQERLGTDLVVDLVAAAEERADAIPVVEVAEPENRARREPLGPVPDAAQPQARKQLARSARALLVDGQNDSRLCVNCGAPLRGRASQACTAKCRAAASRRRRKDAQVARDQEIRALVANVERRLRDAQSALAALSRAVGPAAQDVAALVGDRCTVGDV